MGDLEARIAPATQPALIVSTGSRRADPPGCGRASSP
jgi:hypothetical protein